MVLILIKHVEFINFLYFINPLKSYHYGIKNVIIYFIIHISYEYKLS